MSPLDAILRRRIALDGPMTVGEYMALALGHPEHGYYMGRDPFGEGGDFITAPEVSQVFGELLGAWFATLWRMGGAPDPFPLIELGPGRGTLMADILRAGRGMAGFDEAMTVHLVETSPHLRKRQSETLKPRPVMHHDSLASVPEGAALIVANEFFDALPIRQLVRTEAGWRERVVAVDDDGGGRLVFALSHGGSPVETLLDARVRETAPVGAVAEVSPDSLAVMNDIAGRVSLGGAALIIDYGHGQSGPGDTLQAVRNHDYTDPLKDPGLADITAHVDFGPLKTAALEAGCSVQGPVGQGDFLRALGVEQRLSRLVANPSNADRRDSLEAGVRRLIAEDEMGTLFKVMAVLPAGAPPMPGFSR